MTQDSPIGGRRTAPSPAPLTIPGAGPIVAAAGGGWAVAVGTVALASPTAVAVAGWVAAAFAATGCVLALVARRRAVRTAAVLRTEQHHAALLESELDTLRADLDHAVRRSLPWAAEGIKERASADSILAAGQEHLPTHPAVRELVEGAVRAMHTERRRLMSVLSVLESGASRVQAAVTAQVAELDRRKLPYWQDNVDTGVPHHQVREDLEALDRLLAPMDLLAQRLLVLTGARRTGRPWPRPVPIARVVRAALGRSEDFTRVVAALPPVPQGVRGPAVNAAIHVLSELVDNALRFSPPTTQVHVSVESASSGIVLHIDDSGLPMQEEALQRARATVDVTRPLDITDVSGSRLGLAAARLAGERFGMRIEFRPSITGGTRASVFLPLQWLTAVADSPTGKTPVVPAATERRRPALVPAAPAATDVAPDYRAAPAARVTLDPDTEPDAGPVTLPAPVPAGERRLPKRSRGSTLPERPTERAPDTGTRLAPDEAARRISSFHRAVRPAPPAPSDPSETS
ncbi:sensor histidine kinase [Streptomyces sp. NPDC059134]|uniref:sensor histidine kinase n=1 Tax=Streptomyces sp. NPDC059134 TaxID=3346738 RepID=UPI0036C6BE65